MTLNGNKMIRRRRNDMAWKKTGLSIDEDEFVDYPPGPIDIKPSWRPTNKKDKPPYSYATIIGHAILTSQERRLTLHDIYVWITEHYPYYSNDTQGWQNSIRHNLSLHKSFVKIDRDQCAQNPPRKGCFWTIRAGREKFFIDNLQRPTHHARKQPALSQFMSSRRTSAIKNNSSDSNHNHSNRSSSSSSSSHSSSSSSSSNSSVVSPKETPSTGLLGATTEVSSTTYSESSPKIVSLDSSPSTSGYDLLYHVPETYHVYPEHTIELFGDQPEFYHTSYSPGPFLDTSSQSSSSHLPSLSPCDTYSTTSSSFTTDHHLITSSFMYKTDSDYMLDWASPSAKDTFLQPPIHYSNYLESSFHR